MIISKDFIGAWQLGCLFFFFFGQLSVIDRNFLAMTEFFLGSSVIRTEKNF